MERAAGCGAKSGDHSLHRRGVAVEVGSLYSCDLPRRMRLALIPGSIAVPEKRSAIARIAGLRFEYPGVRALDDVSFTLERGTVTALVGPNGAGKSTLLRCVAGLETPALGQIEVAGIDVLDSPRQAHRRLGYLSDFFGVYDP